MSEGLETEEQDEISELDYVDGKMRMLGISLNLLDPDGTFKGMPSEETLTKIMQAVREDYRQLSDAILALREEEETEPMPKHDGRLGGSGYEDAKVEYYQTYYRPETDAILISGGYGDIESRNITLDAKQALSLLAWLEQEREKLEALAKEQGNG